MNDSESVTELKNRISEVLTNRRNELGLTIKNIAEAIEMSTASVANIISANYDYKYAVLRRVAEALRLDMVHLAFLIEQPQFEDDPVMSEVGALLRKREELRKNSRSNRE